MKHADLSVLLVEPSEIQSRIIHGHLLADGIDRFEWVRKGEEALEILDRNDLHLVISAMHLPDMTGSELIYAIGEMDRPVHPQFMLISSETKETFLEPLRQAGPAALLPKPFTYDDLRKALDHVLDILEPGVLHLVDHDLEELQVLVVDDSTPTRRFIRKLLVDMGLEHITEADDGATAVPLIEETFFDLVITDYNMPQMDGLELTRYIRSESQQRSVPVIMISSEPNPQRLEQVTEAGANAIFPKPFDARVLKELMQQVINGE